MNVFLKKCFYLSIVFLLSIIGSIVFFLLANQLQWEGLPPPRFSSNISFNDKVLFANYKKADCLAIGSSMALCNLHSPSICEFTQTNSYINLGAWGLNIEDTYNITKQYINSLHTPKHLFLSSQIIDFTNPLLDYDKKHIKYFFTIKTPKIWHLKCFDIHYYLNNSAFYNKIKYTSGIVKSLSYDPYGAILSPKEMQSIDKVIWHKSYPPPHIKEAPYIALDSLCALAKHKKINFYFFQTPYNVSVLSNIDTVQLRKHIQRTCQIVTKYGHTFIDATDTIWEETIYIDPVHFKGEGAERFTQYCLQRVENKHPLSCK